MTQFATASAPIPAPVNVEPAAVELLRGKVRIVDVREPHEYRGELGHIPEAELAPLAGLANFAMAWPREAEIVVVCRSGGRSAAAAEALWRMGFRQVRNMVGGMLRWSAERRPVAR